MKKFVLPALLFTVLAVSCKQDKKSLLAKKWQAVALDNPQLSQTIKEQEAFIDTFGKNSDANTNEANYGVRNVDSMRESMRAQLNDFKAMQDNAVKTTSFEFRKDGKAIVNFSGNVDSTTWYFDDEENLVLDEMQLKGAGNKLIMVVNELTDKTLKLTFKEDGLTGTITFEPAK